MKKFFPLIICVLCALNTSAQKIPPPPEAIERNKGNAILAHLTFGVHKPLGDMADRFGADGNFGSIVEYLTEKNFLFGIEGYYLFGSKVNEDPLAILRTPEGGIIGNDRTIASVVLRERGYYVGGEVGKLFASNEKRSGIRLTLGIGYLSHWIRIQDDSGTVTELTGDYKKGYDRLTGGLALNQFIGWQHLAANRRSNWLIGFEFNQAFTNTLRDWDFNDMKKLDENRLDLRIGLRVAWTLPFYQAKSEDVFY